MTFKQFLGIQIPAMIAGRVAFVIAIQLVLQVGFGYGTDALLANISDTAEIVASSAGLLAYMGLYLFAVERRTDALCERIRASYAASSRQCI